MTTITLPAALTPTAAFESIGVLDLVLAGQEDDRFIAALAHNPEMHCLRASLCFWAVIADNEAADALRFDCE